MRTRTSTIDFRCALSRSRPLASYVFALPLLALIVAIAGCSSTPGANGSAQPSSGRAPTSAGSEPASNAAPVAFRDVSQSAGIDFVHQNAKTPRKYLIETMGSGGAFFDFDNDSRLDILLLNCRALPGSHVVGSPTLKLYHNEGNGRFTDVTSRSGLASKPMYAMGVAAGDYDNDGYEDLYITCVLDGSRLYRNMGNGAFHDVTATAGVSNIGKWGTSAAWFDYDKDGLLDLFVCNYVKYGSLKDDQPCTAGSSPIYCIPSAYDKSSCTLYRNEGKGKFRDVSAQTGISKATGKSLGVAVWDYDSDGWLDLFVANDTVPGFLFHNLGGKAFEEVGVLSGVALSEEGIPHSGMGIDADDAHNDGKTTLVITNYYAQETSFYNQPSPTVFRDERSQAGIGGPTNSVLGFGIMWFDFDNDGWKDLLQVNGHVQDDIQKREPMTSYAEPTLLLRNLANGKFEEVGAKAGEPFSKKIVGRGCARGDFDDDGRLDVLITANDGRAMLWRNETETKNHWIKVKLVGVKSNRDGIGAAVTVATGKDRQRTLVRSGSSYLCQSDLRAHFGLGAASSAEIEVIWPSGHVDKVSNVSADSVYTLREGDGRVTPVAAAKR